MKSAILSVAISLAIVTPSLAQAPRPPRDVPPAIFDHEETKSKSDAMIVVGKVLEIDQSAGTVKLQTDEGVVTAKPRPELLRAARVGDTISAPRPGAPRQGADAPSASRSSGSR
jgi:hypothetical protein